MKLFTTESRMRRGWRLIPLLLVLLAGNVYAVDLMAPFRGLKGLFGGNDDEIIVWQGQGQYIKIVDQDWDKDHKRAPRNDHPARVTAPHMAVVLASLQAWRPEDSPESDRSVQLFTNEEISTFAPMLAEALAKAGPKQDVVFAMAGRHADFVRDSNRTSAGRMFVTNDKLNIIFGDILRPLAGDADNISHYTEPHRAGKRMESNGRDIVVNRGAGMSYYTPFERSRVDWIIIDVPSLVAAYRGPELIAPPAPVVTATSPAGGALSQENRKLREELARLRKEGAEGGSGSIPAVAAQPPLVNQNTAAPESVSRAMAQPSSAPAATATESVQKRLQLLKDLHDQGLITDKEYDAKRKEIVDQI